VATFNPTALEILRKPKEEVEGRPISELLPLEDEIRRVLSDTDAVLEKEVKLSSEGKGKSFLGLSVSPLKEPESSITRGAVIIVRDLTLIRELNRRLLSARSLRPWAACPQESLTRYAIRSIRSRFHSVLFRRSSN
jgi:nitrogen fixation/metabolism regulation signal transduction histidine kinase